MYIVDSYLILFPPLHFFNLIFFPKISRHTGSFFFKILSKIGIGTAQGVVKQVWLDEPGIVADEPELDKEPGVVV